MRHETEAGGLRGFRPKAAMGAKGSVGLSALMTRATSGAEWAMTIFPIRNSGSQELNLRPECHSCVVLASCVRESPIGEPLIPWPLLDLGANWRA